MSNAESVTTWIGYLKDGKSEVAGHIWQRYVEKMVRLARRKLGRTPRGVADEEDVVVSAFEAFLRGVSEERFPRLDDRNDLWQVLVMLTERRAIAQRRRELALKRGGGQLCGDSIFADGGGSQHDGLDQMVGREPSPEFAAEVSDQLRSLLELLGDEVRKQVALGKLAGKTNRELAGELGISLRAVERKLALIRDKWSGMDVEE